MRGTRFKSEFKIEAIKQIKECGDGFVKVLNRLDVSDKSLYVWLKQNPKNQQTLNISLALRSHIALA